MKIIICFVEAILLVMSCGEKSKEASASKNKTAAKSSTVSSKSDAISKSDLASLTPNQKLGKRLFIMCQACHNVKKGDPHKVGPNLHGVFGRKAGTEPQFVYSEALLNTDIVWSNDTIRDWLKDPNDYIPGTNMVFVGLQKKHQQDALLEYLHHVTK